MFLPVTAVRLGRDPLEGFRSRLVTTNIIGEVATNYATAT